MPMYPPTPNPMYPSNQAPNPMYPPNQAPNSNVEPQVLHKANDSFVQSLLNARENMHPICYKYMNRPVRIQTIDGMICDGTIASVDRGTLSFQVQQPVIGRPLYNPAYYHYPIGHYSAYGYNPSFSLFPLYDLFLLSLL